MPVCAASPRYFCVVRRGSQEMRARPDYLGSQTNSLRAFSAFGLTALPPGLAELANTCPKTTFSGDDHCGPDSFGYAAPPPGGVSFLSLSVRAARLVNCLLKGAESSPRQKDNVPSSSPLLNVCGLHGQLHEPVPALRA